MDVSAPVFERSARGGFILISLALIVLAVLNTLQHRWNISADMAYLLEAQPRQTLSGQWLGDSAKQFENQFALVLQGPLDENAYTAEFTVAATLEEFEQRYRSMFSLTDHSDLLQKLTDSLKPKRFNLLNPALHKYTDTEVTDWLKRRVFQPQIASVSGLSLLQDPLQSIDVAIQNALSSPDSEYYADRMALLDSNTQRISLVLSYQLHDSALDLSNQQRLVAQVNTLETTLLEALPHFQLLRLGPVFHANYAAQSMKQDLTLIATGSSVGILLLFAFFFRRGMPLVVSFGSVAVGFAAAFTLCNFLFDQLHFIVLVFGASLIGVSVDFALHFFCKYLHSPGETGNRVALSLFTPLLLSLLSSILGYGCLSFSGLSSLYQIAVFSGTGLMMAWLFLLAAASLLPPFSSQVAPLSALIGWLSRSIGALKVSKRRMYAVMGFTGAAAFAVLLWQYQPNDIPKLMYHTSEPLIEDMLQAAKVMEEYDSSRVLFVTGSDEADVFEKLALLQPTLQQWQELGLLQQYHSVLDLLPSITRQQQNFLRNRELYARDGAVQRTLQQLGFSEGAVQALEQPAQQLSFKALLPSDIEAPLLMQNWWFVGDKGHAAIVQIKTTEPHELASALVKAGLPHVAIVSRSEQITSILASIRHHAQTLLLLAYLVIFALFFVHYRSITSVKLILIPLISSFASLAILSFWGGINAFHVFALYLVLGLGVDYAVFYQATRLQPSASTLAAIVLAAATSLLSFGLLALSDTPMIGDFGKTLALGISFNLSAIVTLHTLVPDNP